MHFRSGYRTASAAIVLGATLFIGGPVVAGVNADNLAIVVNTADPDSVAIAAYYQQRRHVPARNIVRIAIPDPGVNISAGEFNRIKADVDRQTHANIEAYALTWLKPYRVECMSITAAFAFGFHREFCAEGCKLTRTSPYFDSHSDEPVVDYAMRPAMSIAARTVALAKQLIDRGVAADGSNPSGTAYLLSTSDISRNVRATRYAAAQALSFGITVKRMNADVLSNAQDVMFYFTGSMRVAQLDSNRFLPGAVADHLTSTGGDLLGISQMSALRWLEAGATGSYGTVIEPCNFTSKFPDPAVMMKHYLAGETLIEAYWKSVEMPGQGIFVGEPLAAPYRTR